MYPLIQLLIVSGVILSQVGGTSAVPDASSVSGSVRVLGGLIAFFAPFFLIPLTFKWAGSAFGNLAGIVNDKSKGLVDRPTNWLKKRNEEKRAIGKMSSIGKSESADAGYKRAFHRVRAGRAPWKPIGKAARLRNLQSSSEATRTMGALGAHELDQKINDIRANKGQDAALDELEKIVTDKKSTRGEVSTASEMLLTAYGNAGIEKFRAAHGQIMNDKSSANRTKRAQLQGVVGQNAPQIKAKAWDLIAPDGVANLQQLEAGALATQAKSTHKVHIGQVSDAGGAAAYLNSLQRLMETDSAFANANAGDLETVMGEAAASFGTRFATPGGALDPSVQTALDDARTAAQARGLDV